LFLVVALFGQDAVKERALGAQLAKDLGRRTTAVETPEVVQHVNRVGQILAAQLRPSIEWTIRVIREETNGRMHEPVVYPAGYIFVSEGLLREAHSEAELAGVMAHAMAHIALRHGRTGGGTIPVVYTGGWGDENAVAPARWLEQKRREELDADRAAAKALVDARYDAEEFVNYVRRTQPEAANALPPREQRIAELERAVRELERRQLVQR
jgi:predicted Zn-dependent protease